MTFAAAPVKLFLADLAHMRDIAEELGRRIARRAAVSLVQAQVLRQLRHRLGRLGHDRFERVLQDHRVMHVGAGYNHRDWPAVCFG
jgi:hypothetical protein